jgi:hypothetical protein
MLRSLLTIVVFLFVPLSASGDSLTKAQFAALYVDHVPPSTIATRIIGLYDALSPAAKATAKAMLKQDLLDALQDQLDVYQDQYVGPAEEDQTDVNDTTLP